MATGRPVTGSGDGRPGLAITHSVVLGRHNATSMRILTGEGVESPRLSSPGTPMRASEKWIWLTTYQKNLTYGSKDPDQPDISDLADNEKEAIDVILHLDRTKSEAARMNRLLHNLGSGFAAMKKLSSIGEEEEEKGDEDGQEAAPDAAQVSEMLLSLRDIVGERIDYAKAFVAMGGMGLLLGGAAERIRVPRSVRFTCLRVLANLVKINRSLQYSLLDNHGIRALAAMYFNEYRSAEANHHESDGKIRGRIVETVDAAVCGHTGAERMFCSNPEARKVIESGIGMHKQNDDAAALSPPPRLRKQCLQFLDDLIGPGAAVRSKDYAERLESFAPALNFIAKHCLDDDTEPDWECREQAIKTVRHVLKSEKGKEIIGPMKASIGTTGVKRIRKMNSLDRQESNASETERTDEELYQWKQLTEELEMISPN